MTNKQIDNISKQINKVSISDKKLDDSYEEYTSKEIEYLDKYKEYTKHKMDDEELYDIIIKYDFNDFKIKNELSEMMKLINKKGDEYGWQMIEKGKSII